MNRKLKNEIAELIEEGSTIKLKWNCGLDEIVLSTYVDDEKLDYDDEILNQLDVEIINLLDLVDAGEFEMKGEAEFVEKNCKIFLEYKSVWNDRFGETPEFNKAKSDEYSGFKILFEVF